MRGNHVDLLRRFISALWGRVHLEERPLRVGSVAELGFGVFEDLQYTQPSAAKLIGG